MSVQQEHGVVLHEVDEAQGSLAPPTGRSAEQGAAPLHPDIVDVLSNGVKEVTEVRPGRTSNRHLHTLYVFLQGVHHIPRDTDDRGDVVAGEHQFVVGGHPTADTQAPGDP